MAKTITKEEKIERAPAKESAPPKTPSPKKQGENLERSTIQTMKIAAVRWLKPNWKIMSGAIAANVAVGALTGSLPIFLQKSLGALFDPQSQIPLYFISGAIFFLLTFRATATYIGNFLNAYLGLRIMTGVQLDLFQHFLLADYHIIGSQHSGQMVASFMNEARMVDGLIGGQAVILLRYFITLIGVFGAMIYINWQLSLFVIGFMPFVFFSMFSYGKLVREYFNKSMSQTGNINAHIVEAARGAKIIRAYGKEKQELTMAQGRITELLRNMARVQRARAASGPSAELIVGIGMAMIFFYVGYQGRGGNFTQGDLVGFITAMLLIYQPLKALAGAQASIQIARAACDRVLGRLEVKSKIISLPNAPKLLIESEREKRRIHFDKVSFRYPDTKKLVLRNISFGAHPNEMIALVGHSGGGKSTIFNLLERFYDVNQGSIKIDGQDIRKVDIASLRQSISLVLQDIFLFDDNIANNIAYARPHATKAEVIQAAKLAHAHEFIEEMPQGYETKIGENGQRLSGGQRQRIAFARAALRDTPILLLDEPTSALDSESEEALQQGLSGLAKGRTVIIIAHRLSTIKNADRIFVIDSGQVIERGAHQKLMARGGVYKNLYNKQFLDDRDS